MKYFLISIFVLFSVSCAHQIQKPIAPTTLSQDLKASHYGKVYFSAQPTMDQIKSLKEQGFVAVINLRSPKEYNELRENKTVNRIGLDYLNFPVSGNEPISEKTMDQITEAVKKYQEKGKVLVHCSSSNRVGLWAGVHFYKDHGYSKEEALEAGRKAGITKDFIEQKLKNYLENK